jgi:phosphatidylglycerophosphatase C
VVAAFDFDGTLTRGGSVVAFLRAVSNTNLVSAGLRRLPALGLAGLLGGAHTDRVKEQLFVATLSGLPAEAVKEQAGRFGLEHYERHARADTAARLAAHRAAGDRVVMVSASPELYVAPVARRLGADGVIATRLAVDRSGRLTGRYDGANCRGSEKTRRLRAWMAEELPGETPVVWAYGNSRGDLALLREAAVGVNVGRLGRWGCLREFPALSEVADRPGDRHPAD